MNEKLIFASFLLGIFSNFFRLLSTKIAISKRYTGVKQKVNGASLIVFVV